MDFWLVAAVAGAGYLSKYWQSIAKEHKLSLLSSVDSNHNNKLESTNRLLRGLTNQPRQRSNVRRDKTISEDDELDFTLSNLRSGFLGNEELEEDVFSGEEMDYRGPTRNISSFGTKMSHLRWVKSVNSLDSCLMAQLNKERSGEIRPLFVTDDRYRIRKSRRSSCSGRIGTEEREFSDEGFVGNGENVRGIPRLSRIGSLDHYMKAKTQTDKRLEGKDFNPLDGSLGGTSLLCLGISIGIMASFMTNKREVDKLKELLKQNENLVQDLQDELEMKDSLTVKELANEHYESPETGDHNSVSKRVSNVFPGELIADKDCTQKADESFESISKIEAELEAELEMLGLNINSSSLKRRSADVNEIDPGFEVDFSQGELRVDLLGVEETEPKSDKDGASSSTTRDTGNYAVSPRDLSLRLHELIQSRLEDRVNELETALQNSQRKIQVMESVGTRNWVGQSNSPLRFSPIAKEEPNSVPGTTLVSAELMRLSDSEEEDSPQRIYEDDLLHCSKSLHGVFQSSAVENGLEIPEEKSVVELFPGSLGSNESTNSRDEMSNCDDDDDEVERELIKQIVERTKKGSSVVINAQRLLSSMQENEHL